MGWKNRKNEISLSPQDRQWLDWETEMDDIRFDIKGVMKSIKASQFICFCLEGPGDCDMQAEQKYLESEKKHLLALVAKYDSLRRDMLEFFGVHNDVIHQELVENYPIFGESSIPTSHELMRKLYFEIS